MMIQDLVDKYLNEMPIPESDVFDKLNEIANQIMKTKFENSEGLFFTLQTSLIIAYNMGKSDEE